QEVAPVPILVPSAPLRTPRCPCDRLPALARPQGLGASCRRHGGGGLGRGRPRVGGAGAAGSAGRGAPGRVARLCVHALRARALGGGGEPVRQDLRQAHRARGPRRRGPRAGAGAEQRPGAGLRYGAGLRGGGGAAPGGARRRAGGRGLFGGHAAAGTREGARPRGGVARGGHPGAPSHGLARALRVVLVQLRGASPGAAGGLLRGGAAGAAARRALRLHRLGRRRAEPGLPDPAGRHRAPRQHGRRAAAGAPFLQVQRPPGGRGGARSGRLRGRHGVGGAGGHAVGARRAGGPLDRVPGGHGPHGRHPGEADARRTGGDREGDARRRGGGAGWLWRRPAPVRPAAAVPPGLGERPRLTASRGAACARAPARDSPALARRPVRR
ncbi:unnamed protein product, partial [Prorocentrum cordatum]